MLRKQSKLLSGLLLISLSGCAANMSGAGVRTVSDSCLIFKGISYAEKATAVEDQRNRFDTPLTIAAIQAHNLAYEAVCGE